jgi:hypothetical protein
VSSVWHCLGSNVQNIQVNRFRNEFVNILPLKKYVSLYGLKLMVKNWRWFSHYSVEHVYLLRQIFMDQDAKRILLSNVIRLSLKLVSERRA